MVITARLDTYEYIEVTHLFLENHIETKQDTLSKTALGIYIQVTEATVSFQGCIYPVFPDLCQLCSRFFFPICLQNKKCFRSSLLTSQLQSGFNKQNATDRTHFTQKRKINDLGGVTESFSLCFALSHCSRKKMIRELVRKCE